MPRYIDLSKYHKALREEDGLAKLTTRLFGGRDYRNEIPVKVTVLQRLSGYAREAQELLSPVDPKALYYISGEYSCFNAIKETEIVKKIFESLTQISIYSFVDDLDEKRAACTSSPLMPYFKPYGAFVKPLDLLKPDMEKLLFSDGDKLATVEYIID